MPVTYGPGVSRPLEFVEDKLKELLRKACPDVQLVELRQSPGGWVLEGYWLEGTDLTGRYTAWCVYTATYGFSDNPLVQQTVLSIKSISKLELVERLLLEGP